LLVIFLLEHPMPQGVFLLVALLAAFTNVIDYVTIATTGNATDFGDNVPLLNN
jgi:hypothetical protein